MSLSKKQLFIVVSVLALALFLVVLIVLVKTKGKKSETTENPPIPETLLNVRSGKHSLALQQNGKTRTYLIYVPSSYNKNEKTPLVFSLHGGGSNATEQMGLNDLTSVADKENFIVVFPNALGSNWNDGRTNTIDKSGNSDDVGFIKLIIEKLSQWISIDASKIYSTGISNGGMMSIRLACDAADTFAAIAPVAASLPEELKAICSPTTPISVLEIQGTGDPLVSYAGGVIHGLAGRTTSDRGVLLSATDSINFWTSFNKCSGAPKISNFPDTVTTDGTTSSESLYETCQAGTQVGLITVTGGGHTWPGGKQYLGERLVGKVSKDFSASQMIWDFFKNKSR